VASCHQGDLWHSGRMCRWRYRAEENNRPQPRVFLPQWSTPQAAHDPNSDGACWDCSLPNVRANGAQRNLGPKMSPLPVEAKASLRTLARKGRASWSAGGGYNGLHSTRRQPRHDCAKKAKGYDRSGQLLGNKETPEPSALCPGEPGPSCNRWHIKLRTDQPAVCRPSDRSYVGRSAPDALAQNLG